MPIIFDAPVTPDALTGFVREVPTPASQILSNILPNQIIDKAEVDLAELTRTNRTARFRAWDARLHVSERDVTVTRKAKLPPLSTSISVGELERLQLEYARLGGSSQTAMINAIYDDATNLTGEVYNRMEQARGDVLVDGKFTLTNEGGLTMEADFGVPVGHFVTAGTVWSNAAASIITDLTGWQQTYVDANGTSPDGMLISTTILNAMLRNTEIRTLSASLAGAPGLVTRPALEAALAAFGLPPIAYVYDAAVDVDGTTTKIIPVDRVVFFSQGLGRTVWGVTATALELVNSNHAEIGFSEAAGTVGVVIKEGPPFRQFTFVDAVGMPVLDNPKRLFVADVL